METEGFSDTSEIDSLSVNSASSSSKARKFQIFISTGEVSGDLQGAMLIEALLSQAERLNCELEIVGLGGDRMAQAGAKILANTTAIGSVGIIESLQFILPTLNIQRQAKKYLETHPPDLVILIDYMEPNLSIGAYLRKSWTQVPIVYYIAPQEWVASVSLKNTQRIVKSCDLLLAIFPEEARYYQYHQANVDWIGHPLLDRISHFPTRQAARASLGIGDGETAIALLPVSRPQELKYLLPVIFQAAAQIQSQIPHVRYWIPLSLEAYRQTIEEAIARYKLNATLVSDRTPEVLAAADLAITKSGTVNLELALLNVPQVVIYRVNPITFWLGMNILRLKIPFMSPVNLVLMRSIVPELMQDLASAENIFNEAIPLIQNPEKRQQISQDYQEMRAKIGELGVCDRAAQKIINLLLL
ncbi:lipid-A-disaccharide synthase [Merismopedia glauca]|uniref:Lipid-A-disaccharide synthase n=1 Tax=Merismopedia glauca CCAP 1448/3 TaxID=1296344 RepID=A0A2T1C672_9CYAN|nr:lipid-A-disaccharide synthase [Merismopedia glauca]PSB03736.1 lipid-A-disaccharide synthase [Merismopedia glauca CCAP 1448/3]